ncbi:MAG: hypothetical protein KDB58_00615 [Solirubrobacterales bacterium]|nr:hypothetical protein [Solirubrobacterales bacterium]MCB8971281.1 hypothetical protein [Thermoleophilales bacterium]MCO5325862.1 hypothetical protein [Solirubrobacterales bacterium]
MNAPQGSSRGHADSDKGGKPVGTRVKLPRGAADPIRVYINGHEQKPGLDYNIVNGEIVFKEPIIKEDLSELSAFRKVVFGLGLVGTYQRDETIDIEYSLKGKRELASDLEVIPDS